MVPLNVRVPNIILSFFVPDAETIPLFIRSRDKKLEKGTMPPRNVPAGEVSIAQTPGCTIEGFINDLFEMRYEIIGVHHFYLGHADPHAKGPRGYIIRFVVTHPDHVPEPDWGFYSVRSTLREELRLLAKTGLWRMQLSSTSIGHGDRQIHVEMDQRMPLFRAPGKPTLIWERDTKGQALPIRPKRLTAGHSLRIAGAVLKLESLQQ